MAVKDKITPDNIEEQLNAKKQKHNGRGYRFFSICVTLRVPVTRAADIFGVHPDTMKKYYRVETTRREKLKIKDEEALDALKDA